MLKILVLYVHLIATCVALGLIIRNDLRLVGKLLGYHCLLPVPHRFERRLIGASLAALLVSGACLLALGLRAEDDFLHNEKLQAKLLCAGLLCANAFCLHRITFPYLRRRLPVSQWSPAGHLAVALPVALSNGMWFSCAFLGIARPWNHTVSVGMALLPGALLVVALALAILAGLRIAARELPAAEPDWLDSLKSRLSDHAPLDEAPLAPRPSTY
jgi:hypothetical protein